MLTFKSRVASGLFRAWLVASCLIAVVTIIVSPSYRYCPSAKEVTISVHMDDGRTFEIQGAPSVAVARIAARRAIADETKAQAEAWRQLPVTGYDARGVIVERGGVGRYRLEPTVTAFTKHCDTTLTGWLSNYLEPIRNAVMVWLVFSTLGFAMWWIFRGFFPHPRSLDP